MRENPGLCRFRTRSTKPLKTHCRQLLSVKEYENAIIWLDYFNKVLPRSRGRRMKRDVCVSDPTLENLAKAVEVAGFSVADTNEGARYPRRPYVKSGYVAVSKTIPKTRMLYRIAPKLVRVTNAGKKN